MKWGLTRLASLGLLVLLTACAGRDCLLPATVCLRAAPAQALPAAGRLQAIEGRWRDQHWLALVQLEWQPRAGRLQVAAATPSGQMLYQLGWDGRRLDWAPGPLPLAPGPVLLDLQLAFLPLALLPADWPVGERDSPEGRLRWLGPETAPWVRVRYGLQAGDPLRIEHPSQELFLEVRVLEDGNADAPTGWQQEPQP